MAFYSSFFRRSDCIMLLFRLPLVLGLVTAILATAPARADDTSPRQVIEQFHTGLSSVLDGTQAQDFTARQAALCPVLQDSMAIAFQGAASVGRRAWNGWTPDQRAAYRDHFERYLCAAYANRFDAYSGEAFVITGTRPGPRNAVIVETEVQVSGDAPVPIDYVLRPVSGGWAITDLFLDGTVSEVALRRAAFSAVLRDQGLDALLALMDQKVAEWGNTAP